MNRTCIDEFTTHVGTMDYQAQVYQQKGENNKYTIVIQAIGEGRIPFALREEFINLVEGIINSTGAVGKWEFSSASGKYAGNMERGNNEGVEYSRIAFSIQGKENQCAAALKKFKDMANKENL